MYLINQVSKITGLTKKALRYYDEQGILVPSARDEVTQYRYYDDCDLEKAQIIIMLRKLDFSISEIKDALNVAQNSEDLNYIMKEKINHIKLKISKEKALIKKMDRCMEPVSTVTENKNYEITIENIDSVMVASLQVKRS